MHVRVLTADRIARRHGVEITAGRGSEASVEKLKDFIGDIEDVAIAGQAVVPGEPQEREGMPVGVAGRVGHAAIRGERMYEAGVAVGPIERRHHVVDTTVCQAAGVRIPAKHAGVTVDVELAALHHEALGSLFERAPIKVEALVKAAARPIDADTAPERQRVGPDPIKQRRQRLAQQREPLLRGRTSARGDLGRAGRVAAAGEARFEEGQKIAPGEQEARNAGSLCGRDVALPIANQEACVLVDCEVGERAQDHARPGLAVDVAATELGHAPLRMVGAMIERIDDRAVRGELLTHPVVQGEYAVLAIKSVGNAGLVGDHHNPVAEMVEAAHAFDRARNPFDLVGSMHVAAIDVDDAIAIEECGRP